MKVQDVMTSPAHSCTPDASLKAAAITMCDYGCGALPVLDNAGRPVGILTDRDICMTVALDNQFPAAIRVRQVMTFNPLTCRPGADVGEVLDLMATHRIRRLPVVDENGRLVGIVSLADVVSAVKEAGTLDSALLGRLVAASRRAAAPRPWIEGTASASN
jgi:CBS domain-containing protein